MIKSEIIQIKSVYTNNLTLIVSLSSATNAFIDLCLSINALNCSSVTNNFRASRNALFSDPLFSPSINKHWNTFHRIGFNV